MKKILLFFIAVLTVSSLKAKIVLTPLVADDMVLQRNADVNIWGKAEPSATVTVTPSWSGITYSTRSDAEGNWSLKVNTDGVGGPYTMKFSDGEELVLHNILLGDVWLCSGQSNMEMNMRGFASQPVEHAQEFIVGSEKYPDIRMFTMKMVCSVSPREEIPGKWAQASIENTPYFSATGYFFAKTLNEVLDVPIGIIHTSWGGTVIEAWMSRENVQKYPHFDPETIFENPKAPWIKHTMIYNAMLYPLRRLTVKGFAWYQGEANIQNYEQYPALFADMVKEWRGLFQDAENAPFYFVQIAPFCYDGSDEEDSAFLREAQTRCLEVPNTGMAVTLDTGEEFIIHPKQKEIVGKRLAYQALAKTYHKPIVCDGPVYKEMVEEKGKLVVTFDHADGGLCPLHENLEGFEVAGSDGKYVPAQARARYGSKVEVWSDQVKHPRYLRYGFRNYVRGSLYNAYHLPAGSFRTDDFEPAK